MAGDTQVLGLLEEMLDAGKTPDEVCRGCPELLAEVRDRWREFRRLDAAVVELPPGLRTAPYVGAVTPVPAVADLPQVPGYKLSGEVGRGGMGVVYKARDLSLDRDVAVKLLQDGYPADSPIARRFADEARITAQLQHPGIPPVHDLGTLPDGRPFLAMKLIKGSTLDHLLAPRPRPRSRPVRGGVRASLPDGGVRPRPRRDPPGPEAVQRDGGGVRRGPGHGLGPGQGLDGAGPGGRPSGYGPGYRRGHRDPTRPGCRPGDAGRQPARHAGVHAAGAGHRGGGPGRRAERRLQPGRHPVRRPDGPAALRRGHGRSDPPTGRPGPAGRHPRPAGRLRG